MWEEFPLKMRLKEEGLVEIVQKKRRIVKGFGCVRDLKRVCGDWKSRGLEIEEVV